AADRQEVPEELGERRGDGREDVARRARPQEGRRAAREQRQESPPAVRLGARLGHRLHRTPLGRARTSIAPRKSSIPSASSRRKRPDGGRAATSRSSQERPPTVRSVDLCSAPQPTVTLFPAAWSATPPAVRRV